MKIRDILHEDKGVEDIISIIKQDCKKYIKEARNAPALYRGFDGKFIFQKIKSRLEDRIPRNTSKFLHDKINEQSTDRFGWPIRNGVFATNDLQQADIYGFVYFFFPIGNYEYVWSLQIRDLYAMVSWAEFLENKEKNEATSHYKWDTLPLRGKDKKYDGHWTTKDGKVITDKIRDKYSIYLNIDQMKFHEYDPYTKQKKVWVVPVFSGRINEEFLYWKTIDFDDWFMREEERLESHLNELLDTYKTTDLKSAAKTHNEISFKCKEYYLLYKTDEMSQVVEEEFGFKV